MEAGWSNNGNINIATGSTSAQGGRCAVRRGSLESCRFMCCSSEGWSLMKNVLQDKLAY